MFNINKKILKKLIIIEEFYIKLIFSRYINLNYGNYYKFKVIYIANYKNNIIKLKKKNLKIKVKQFKKKQIVAKMHKKKEKFASK